MAEAGRHSAGELVAGLDIPFERDVPLGPRTWYGVGGPAEVLAKPREVQQLAALMRGCREAGVPVCLLGKGANLLVADAGVRGVVVQLDAPAFRKITIDGTTAIAGGGADLGKLIVTCARAGLAGLEVLAGIPATVGGAVRMNAGGSLGEIGRTVTAVTVMSDAGEIRTYERSALQFAYRRSNIAEPIILEARFDLTRDDPVRLLERVKELTRRKDASQPVGRDSAGCTFKNPPPHLCPTPAGKLIDDAGLKGQRIGGAEVSPRHANFIIVHPGGTADDVLKLIEHVQRRVREKFGVALEREIVVWGEREKQTRDPVA